MKIKLLTDIPGFTIGSIHQALVSKNKESAFILDKTDTGRYLTNISPMEDGVGKFEFEIIDEPAEKIMTDYVSEKPEFSEDRENFFFDMTVEYIRTLRKMANLH